jgi:hypothetical protein
MENSMFGLVRPKVEGAPMHPEDLLWEHDIRKCKECKAKYNRQLAAYNEWEKEYYGK